MTTVKASCPVCGDVEMNATAVTVWTSDTRPDLDHYAFTCPRCQDTVTKPATPEVLDLLIVGAHIPPQRIPAEAAEDHYGPVISWDDVCDFINELDEWVGEP